MPCNTLRQKIGNDAEDLACSHLLTHGLSLIERNFSTPLGEIDLIMREKDTIVFVEVRSRSKIDAYGPSQSVNVYKQHRIMKTSLLFLKKKGWLDLYACRFDVIGITYLNGQPLVEWIKHAFS